VLCDDFKKRYDGLPIATNARDRKGKLETAEATFCHNHREIEMVCVLEGEAMVHIGNTVYTVKEGETVFISPYVLHYTEMAKNTAYVSRCVCFDASLLRDTALGRALEEGNAALTSINDSEKVFLSVKRIYEACVFREEGWRMEVQGWLLLLFSFLKRNGDIQTVTLPQDEVFCRQVLTFLREHYAENITSADVSAAVFLSQGHFCRQFRAKFNDSFSNYLRRYRLEKACEMLYETAAPVTAVARAVGFDDPSYFTKCFRETFGMTPRAYKKRRVLV